MNDTKRDYEWKMRDVRARMTKAMAEEAVFDGWSEAAFEAAMRQAGVDAPHAKLAFPRGALDVAICFHRLGDQEMLENLPERLKGISSIREKIATAIMLRIEIADRDKEAVRRATALMALPQNMSLGSALIWETADHIWRGIGDDAAGFSYYSKRTSLGAVYSSVLLYWLGSDASDMNDIRAFLERRLDNLMQFGKMTSKIKAPFSGTTIKGRAK